MSPTGNLARDRLLQDDTVKRRLSTKEQSLGEIVDDIIELAYDRRSWEIAAYGERDYLSDAVVGAWQWLVSDNAPSGEMLAAEKILQDQSTYEGIREEFARFDVGDTDAYTALSQQFSTARDLLMNGPAKTALSEARTAMTGWRGSAAANFTENFLAPLAEMALHNHAKLLDSMCATVNAHRAMVENAHDRIHAIAVATRTALDEYPDGKTATQTLNALIPVVVAAMVFAVDPPVGAGAMTMAFANLGSYVFAAGTALSSTEPVRTDIEVSGDSVENILESMRTALHKLGDELEEVDDWCAANLADWSSEMDDQLATPDLARFLLPARPTMDRGDDPDLTGKFHPAG